MRQHAVIMNGTRPCTDNNQEYHEVDISRAIIGMIVYMACIAPIITLLSVSALEIGSAYIMPVFFMLLMAGIYITEKYYCRNSH